MFTPAVAGLLPIHPAVAQAEYATDGITDQLYAELLTRTGLDLSRYRRATVDRRITNRMLAVGVESRSAYLDLLRTESDEAVRLLERVTIKVSRFYRNAPVFEALAVLLPDIAQARGGAPLNIWSAGCGRGEEVWSLAMLLDITGTLGNILATDVDASAMTAASTGIYGADALRELPVCLRDAYLEDAGPNRWRISDGLRHRVHFGLLDLTSRTLPAEVAGFDLVLCRNVLIYFDAGVQQQTFGLLHAALKPQGTLCLGEAEWPMHEAAQLFCVQSSALRIFSRGDTDA